MPVAAERAAITPAFFPALGVTLRAGRPFAAGETSAARTMILSETVARRLFPDRSPIGATVWIGETSYDVVGLVADYANNPFHEPAASPRIFVPLPAAAPRRMAFLIRANDPAALVQTVRRELRDAAVGNVVTGVGTAEQTLQGMGQEVMIGTAPLFPLIVIGVLLTTAGIYGVLAFAVARRATRARRARRRRRDPAGYRPRSITMAQMRLVGDRRRHRHRPDVRSRPRRARRLAVRGSMFDPTLSAFMVPIGSHRRDRHRGDMAAGAARGGHRSGEDAADDLTSASESERRERQVVLELLLERLDRLAVAFGSGRPNRAADLTRLASRAAALICSTILATSKSM